MEFFKQGVCTALESFPSIRQMKKQQSMIVRKLVEGRDGYCQQDLDQILPGVCKALRDAGKDSFPKFPVVFAACPLKSNMMEQVQSLRNNKITAVCIGESADIDRKLATRTT